MEFNKTDLEFMEKETERLRDFLKELYLPLSIRLVNGFTFAAKSSNMDAKNYIVNLIKITGGDYKLAQSKVNSKEFLDVINAFKFFPVDECKKINKRLDLYYGEPGGGKTTEALRITNGNCIICNSSMLPSDLIEDFKLKDGKGNLIPSPLRHAMEYGEQICLDEINTLSVDALRFLQGLTDNKKEFKYKDETIKIHPNFKIIGTFNLFIGDAIYPITPALADRVCYDGLKEFNLNSKKLVSYAFSE